MTQSFQTTSFIRIIPTAVAEKQTSSWQQGYKQKKIIGGVRKANPMLSMAQEVPGYNKVNNRIKRTTTPRLFHRNRTSLVVEAEVCSQNYSARTGRRSSIRNSSNTHSSTINNQAMVRLVVATAVDMAVVMVVAMADG